MKGKKVEIEPLIDVNAENSGNNELTIEEPKLIIAKQRNLHSAKKSSVNQPVREVLRGSLSKSLKSRRPKLNPGTPEKSEIFKLYEKLTQK